MNISDEQGKIQWHPDHDKDMVVQQLSVFDARNLVEGKFAMRGLAMLVMDEIVRSAYFDAVNSIPLDEEIYKSKYRRSVNLAMQHALEKKAKILRCMSAEQLKSACLDPVAKAMVNWDEAKDAFENAFSFDSVFLYGWPPRHWLSTPQKSRRDHEEDRFKNTEPLYLFFRPSS